MLTTYFNNAFKYPQRKTFKRLFKMNVLRFRDCFLGKLDMHEYVFPKYVGTKDEYAHTCFFVDMDGNINILIPYKTHKDLNIEQFG